MKCLLTCNEKIALTTSSIGHKSSRTTGLPPHAETKGQLSGGAKKTDAWWHLSLGSTEKEEACRPPPTCVICHTAARVDRSVSDRTLSSARPTSLRWSRGAGERPCARGGDCPFWPDRPRRGLSAAKKRNSGCLGNSFRRAS